jgi:predicted MFS family arabinose efflux permease
LVLVLVLWKKLPSQKPPSRVPYRELLASLPRLVRDSAPVRRHAILGALTFAAFSVFWTTLPFRLATPPLHYGSEVAGLFGLVGVAGALAAPLAGRLADRYGSRWVNAAATAIVVLSYGVFALAGHTLGGLAVGVLLLDFGAQANHISNQTRVLGLDAALRNRLNTVYMVTYFIGGASGSALGAWAWNRWAWAGVSACGAAFGIVGLVAFAVLPGAEADDENED